MMLYEFLRENEKEILQMTEAKSLQLAGVRPTSDQLKKGLPLFYHQLVEVLRAGLKDPSNSQIDIRSMEVAARDNNEPAMTKASGRPEEAKLALESGLHGKELLKLGYTLSHVVHAYGGLCQSITELASRKEKSITTIEFHDLNRCLDVAIAGAVTEYQALQNTQEINREVQHLGFLAHELRNALTSVNVSLQLIKRGTVGFGGSTGKLLDEGLKRIQDLVNRSLTEVRLRVDPQVHIEEANLLQIIDQIVVTADVEARLKNQAFNIKIKPDLTVRADQQLFYSAMSNVIQNALKYSRINGNIEIRAERKMGQIIIEVEDECGGLSNSSIDLFKPFEQQNENRTGLGLGLTIAKRAISLSNGTIEVENIPNKGCIFRISLAA